MSKKNNSDILRQFEEDEEDWEEKYGVKIQKRSIKIQEKKIRKEDFEKEE